MVDIIALSIPHFLLALVALRLFAREDLDEDGGSKPRFGFRRKQQMGNIAQDGEQDEIAL